jgi:hypothetical protein
MWLCSVSTAVRAILLLCALPFLSSCATALLYDLAKPQCDAIRADRERGVTTTTTEFQNTCDQMERERLAEARRIVQDADQRKIQQNAPTVAEDLK